MFYKTVYLLFKNYEDIFSISIDKLLDAITRNESTRVYGIYIDDKFSNLDYKINLLNNLSDATIRFKLIENSYQIITTLGDELIIQLKLNDEPSPIAQRDYFKQGDKYPAALFPLPSNNPGITYNNNVLKSTRAADGNYYDVSRSDNQFISATIEEIEEKYEDISLSSPFPISLGMPDNQTNFDGEITIKYNSTSISNPTFMLLDDNFLKSEYYLMSNNDKNMFSISNLLIIQSINLDMLVFKRSVSTTSRYKITLNRYQKVFAYRAENGANYHYYLGDGNNPDIYLGAGRFDSDVLVKFLKTDKTLPSYLGAIWGYFTINIREYRNSFGSPLISLPAKVLIDSGKKIYSLRSSFRKSLDSWRAAVTGDVLFTVKTIEMIPTLGSYVTYQCNPNGMFIVVNLGLIKITFPEVTDKLLKIKVYRENENTIDEYFPYESTVYIQGSESTKIFINYIFNVPVSQVTDRDVPNLLFSGPKLSDRYTETITIPASEPVKGRYQPDDIGYQIYDDGTGRYFTWPQMSAGRNIFIRIDDWSNKYGMRAVYTGFKNCSKSAKVLIRVTSGPDYATNAVEFQPNSLIVFNDHTIFTKNPIKQLCFVLIDSIATEAKFDSDDLKDNNGKWSFEIYNNKPAYIDIESGPYEKLPPSFLSSIIDRFAQLNYFDLYTKDQKYNTFLDEIGFEPLIIRKDFESVQDYNLNTIDQCGRYDLISLEVPNITLNFPKSGFEQYRIPYEYLRLRYTNNNGITTVIIPNGYKFYSKEERVKDSYHTLDEIGKICIFYNNTFFDHDYFIPFTLDTAEFYHYYTPYKVLSCSAGIAEIAGPIPIDIKTNIINASNSLSLAATILASSISAANPAVSKFNQSIFQKFEIKLPIINVDKIYEVDLSNPSGFYDELSRQIVYTIMIEISYYY